MRFHDIDIESIYKMSPIPKKELLEQFHRNDVNCRAHLLHNYRKGTYIQNIIITHAREVTCIEKLKYFFKKIKI